MVHSLIIYRDIFYNGLAYDKEILIVAKVESHLTSLLPKEIDNIIREYSERFDVPFEGKDGLTGPLKGMYVPLFELNQSPLVTDREKKSNTIGATGISPKWAEPIIEQTESNCRDALDLMKVLPILEKKP